MLAAPPVDPDSPTAQEWLARELAKSEYRAAEPSPLDRAVQAFWEWLRDLQVPATPGGPPVGLIGAVLVLAVLVGIGFLVWGAPRRRRRSGVPAGGELFGTDDARTAAQLRAAAAQAARGGDWATAVAEQFRAIARGLAERTVVVVLPGSTSHGVAARAGAAFPDAARRLAAGAAAFDSVRYLGGAGSEEEWSALERLDRELRGARPLLEAEAALGTAPR